MVSERAQALGIGALIALVIAGLVAVVMFKEPAPQPARGKPRADLESSSKGPIGILHYLAGPEGLVFRYQSGSCTEAGGPEFSLSDDDGWSFIPVRVPQVDDGSGVGAATPTISSVVSVQVEGRRRFVVSGADAKCNLHTYVTTDAGANWIQKTFDANDWYVEPKSGVVFSPKGAANVDCPGIANLTGFDEESAVAYCADGSLYQSDDGETWDRSGSTDEPATAVFFDSPDDGYAVWPDGSCQSRVFRTTNGGSSWAERGCIYPDILIPGIGGTDDLLMAGGNGPVWVSDDGGKSWARPANPDDDSAIREEVNRRSGGDADNDTEDDEAGTDEPSSDASASPSDAPSDDASEDSN